MFFKRRFVFFWFDWNSETIGDVVNYVQSEFEFYNDAFTEMKARCKRIKYNKTVKPFEEVYDVNENGEINMIRG